MRAQKSLERFAIMAVDPGKVTGVAQGFFNATRGAATTRGLMRRALRKDAIRVSHIEAPEAYRDLSVVPPAVSEITQGALLYRAWMSFTFRAATELMIPYPAIFLVIEDFQLRQRSADLSPVRVTSALLAHLSDSSLGWPAMVRADHCLRFQQPAEAKTYATDARLRDWGLWTVGKEHGRDATRHMALLASKALDGKLADPVRSDD